MAIPASHVDEGLKLTADGEVVFFEIALKNIPDGGVAVIRFRDGPMGSTTQWNGKTWDHLACQLTGQQRSSEDEKSRPRLRLINPVGVFNQPAFSGQFDGSVIQKFTVLRRHVESNLTIANNEIFFIGRVVELIAGQSISFELRALSDVPDQKVPARVYMYPEYPTVTL